jgi:antitoxin ParD1/3/4
MTMKISLPEEFSAFVEAQVASGDYATPDDVCRDALRLMQQHVKDEAERLEWLRQAYREGIESGDHGPLDVDALIAEAQATYRKKAG